MSNILTRFLTSAVDEDVPQLWKYFYFLSLALIYQHHFFSAHFFLNEMCLMLMLRCRQCYLGFVLGCIHLLSSWSWSVILFVPDPLPASTIQTHKGGPWRGAWEEKQHIWVWLKPSKLSLRQPDLFLWFILYSTDVQHMEKDILYFLQHVLFVFLWTLRFTEPPQKWSVSLQQLPDDL